MAKKQQKSTLEVEPTSVGQAIAEMVPAVKATPARQTAVPPKAKTTVSAPTKTTTDVDQETNVTESMIAERAYHLWLSGTPGSEAEHWATAERELRSR